MQILRKTLFWKRCVFQPSHWCDSFPQENKIRSLPYLLDYFPVSRPPSLLQSSLEKKRQISHRLPRQVVSHPEPPCTSLSPELTATGTWSRDPLQTPPVLRHGNSLNSPSASAAEGAIVSSTAQRFFVLLRVTDHVLNQRQTPFPLANKELLGFGQGVKRL